MTREHSETSKGSSYRQCIGKQLTKMRKQQRKQQKASNQDSTVASTIGIAANSDKRQSSGSCRSVPPCGGSLVQRRHTDDSYDNNENSNRMDSKERMTPYGMDESSGYNHQHPVGSESVEFTSDEQNLDSKGSDSDEDNSALRASSVALKKQLIFYQGKMQTVYIQVWPEKDRIPMHERHRLQDPMRKRYGVKSCQARLLKEFESAKRQAPFSKGAIPLLSRRMRDEAKVRLLSWYRPLNFKPSHRVCLPDDLTAFQLPPPKGVRSH